MDRVTTSRLVDPDHDQPTCGGRPPYHLVCLPLGQVDLDAIWIAEDLLDILECDPSLGMVLAEMLAVGSVPHDGTFVHPRSIYDL